MVGKEEYTTEDSNDGLTCSGTVIMIDELQSHGINVGDILKLKSSGIFSVSVSGNKDKRMIYHISFTNSFCFIDILI